MRDVIEFMIFMWLLIFTLAAAVTPKAKYDIPDEDLEKYKNITSCVPKEQMLTLS